VTARAFPTIRVPWVRSSGKYSWCGMLAILAAWGCFPSHPTPLPSCMMNGERLATGPLRVLPSEVPGVWIDSAWWFVRTESSEMQTATYLAYEAHLRSDHPAPLDSLAIAFHSSRAADDSLLQVGGWRVPQRMPRGELPRLRVGGDSLRSDEPRTARKVLRLPGTKPGPWACPKAVQVVRAVRSPG
jgi:hypothetical protein